MLLIKKSALDTTLFNIAYMDSPGNSRSNNLYHNILEGATILDSFEDAYKSIVTDYENFGYRIEDYKQFESIVKPFYQALRHGFGFDWIINYFVGEIVRYFPFSHFEKFKGTDPFFSEHRSDPVFREEIGKLEGNFARLIDNIFVSGDPTVLRRLVADSGKTDFIDCAQWAQENNVLDKYVVSEESLYRTNYLVALGMMLNDGVGLIKRNVWHSLLEKIKAQEAGHTEIAAVCGGKYRALAFGNLDGSGPKWHLFDKGIRALDTFDYAIPTQATNLRVTPTTIELVNILPALSIGEWTFVDPASFGRSDLQKGNAQHMRVKYPFNKANGHTVELKAIEGCIIKDQAVALNENGEGETQIVITGDKVQIAVSTPSSLLPYAKFEHSEVNKSQVEWL